MAVSRQAVIVGDATERIPGRTWDEAREPYADYLVDLITAQYIPDLKARILKRSATPVPVSRWRPVATPRR